MNDLTPTMQSFLGQFGDKVLNSAKVRFSDDSIEAEHHAANELEVIGKRQKAGFEFDDYGVMAKTLCQHRAHRTPG